MTTQNSVLLFSKSFPQQSIILLAIILLSVVSYSYGQSDLDAQRPLKALIIDGENNHGVWPKTTMMMKDYLLETGLFEVDIARTHFTWQGPHYDQSIGLDDIKELLTMYPLRNGTETVAVDEPKLDETFNPDFEKYDVVVSNMGWKASLWPEETRAKFEKYMKEGGGLIVVHAANNSWGDWEEFNKMIGIGGWGGRNEDSGYYAFVESSGEEKRQVPVGGCGSHGPQHEYVMVTEAPEHPVMKGLPEKWLHCKDELYDRLCGPAENMTILATAFSDPEKNGPPWNKKVNGTGHYEPLLLTVEYGQGRVFHTGMGHMGYSMECVGFITTFQRGAEWAATGEASQPLPEDFPDEHQTSARKWSFKAE